VPVASPPEHARQLFLYSPAVFCLLPLCLRSCLLAAVADAAVGWSSFAGAKTGVMVRLMMSFSARVDPSIALAWVVPICVHIRCNLVLRLVFLLPVLPLLVADAAVGWSSFAGVKTGLMGKLMLSFSARVGLSIALVTDV